MFDINKLSAIQIGLASPETIESWANKLDGVPLEVLDAETINYRSQKPEQDGLFSERIFGPTHDYECYCGKYKKKSRAGTICEKCRVEVTSKSVRRERMSFVRLASPVTHIWYLKGTPSRIAQVLGMNVKDVEEVVYFVSNVVIDDGGCKFLQPREIDGKPEGRKVLDDIKGKKVFREILEDLKTNGLVHTDDSRYALIDEFIADIDNEESFDFLEISKFIQQFYPNLRFGIGAEAIQTLLANVDINGEYEKVVNEIRKIDSSKEGKAEKKESNSQKKQQLLKRLETLEAFKNSNNKPEWMVLTNLPIIPPDLRPMLPLDGSRFASADLNDLYKRVIQKNKTVNLMKSINAPSTVINNAKRTLQEAVDALIDNGKRTKSIQAKNGRPFKSLSQALKGKQGRFRQNLLGKRVDYSGRSVIAVGPTLRMDECGLPREMAVQLFRPFIARKLVENGVASTTKIAEVEHIDKNSPQMWEALDQVIATHPVLLNRAPTLHRLGIQAFKPRLVDGRAIRLFPLATTAFNADFDGDQMAVHVPLSNEAIWEAENLMLGSRNILGPKDGKPIVTPTKDMVLGNYYLTIEEDAKDFLNKAKEARSQGNNSKAEKYELFAKCEGKVFCDANEALNAYYTNQIHLHTRIAVRGRGIHNALFSEAQNNSYLVTTPGKIIFNEIFDEKEFPFINCPEEENFAYTPSRFFIRRGQNIKEIIAKMPKEKPFKKGFLSRIIDEFLKKTNVIETSNMLNRMKDQGFKFATDSAVTVSLYDIVDLDEKQEMFDETEKDIDQYDQFYEEGLLTDEERHKLVVNRWQKCTEQFSDAVNVKFNSNKRNPFFLMSDSGAAGKKENFNQLAGMKGLMNRPNGDVVELPIKSNFKEGLTVAEFFNSTHGTRKGGADTALKTADSGYLTRKLVNVGHDVIVRKHDCGCIEGMVVKKIIDTSDGTIIEPFRPRIVGRFTTKEVRDANGNLVVGADTLITEALADEIIKAGIEEVEIRNAFTCKEEGSVCQKCYGVNLATGELVNIGEAVGVMAAQSIGEPGTQLTLRNFNTGGVAGGSDITRGLPRVVELFDARNPSGEAKISEIDGHIESIEQIDGCYEIKVKNDKEDKPRVYKTIFGVKLAKALKPNGELVEPIRFLQVGDEVFAGQKLSEGAINPKTLLAITNDAKTVQNYILKEVQKVYLPVQGIEISDKHIELIIKQMFNRVYKVTDPGDSLFVKNSKVLSSKVREENRKLLMSGKEPIKFSQTVLGITKATLEIDSWLSAASFQETTRVLTDATIKGKVDHLKGLKENVIVGKLIPSGTGLLDQRFATNTQTNTQKEAE